MYPQLNFPDLQKVLTVNADGSFTPLARLGEVRADRNGGLYRYVKAGTAALALGELAITDAAKEVAASVWINGVDEFIDGRYFKNVVKLDTPANFGTVDGQFDGWYAVINDSNTAADIGRCFRIEKSFFLEGKLLLETEPSESIPTLTAATLNDITVFSPDVVTIAALTNPLQQVRGVAAGPIAIGSYGWVQFLGFCKEIRAGSAMTVGKLFSAGGAAPGEALIVPAAAATSGNEVPVGYITRASLDNQLFSGILNIG